LIGVIVYPLHFCRAELPGGFLRFGQLRDAKLAVDIGIGDECFVVRERTREIGRPNLFARRGERRRRRIGALG
jgi:hypothetical protein